MVTRHGKDDEAIFGWKASLLWDQAIQGLNSICKNRLHLLLHLSFWFVVSCQAEVVVWGGVTCQSRLESYSAINWIGTLGEERIGIGWHNGVRNPFRCCRPPLFPRSFPSACRITRLSREWVSEWLRAFCLACCTKCISKPRHTDCWRILRLSGYFD